MYEMYVCGRDRGLYSLREKMMRDAGDVALRTNGLQTRGTRSTTKPLRKTIRENVTQMVHCWYIFKFISEVEHLDINCQTETEKRGHYERPRWTAAFIGASPESRWHSRQTGWQITSADSPLSLETDRNIDQKRWEGFLHVRNTVWVEERFLFV